MIYNTTDLNEQERDAWRRGDYAQSALLGQMLDMADEVATLEGHGVSAVELVQERDSLLGATGRDEEKRANAHTAIQDLRDLLDSLPRMSRRKEVDAAVQAITDALTE